MTLLIRYQQWHEVLWRMKK